MKRKILKRSIEILLCILEWRERLTVWLWHKLDKIEQEQREPLSRYTRQS